MGTAAIRYDPAAGIPLEPLCARPQIKTLGERTMNVRSKLQKLGTGALLAMILVPAGILGQADEQQKRVAELKQAVQASLAGLRKYEWIETTTVSLKGEVKSQKQNRCDYGVDGKIQRVPIGETQPQEQSRGRRGRIKSRVIAKKKGEMTEYMKQAVDLASL